ncbi:MAG: hypothetical protein V8S53_00225 [Lachnospiraceae bacterium]
MKKPTKQKKKQDSYVQVKGLEAFADCGNGTNTPDEIVDGDKSTYWHSALEGEMQPEKQRKKAYTEMNKYNNITLLLKLAQASTVKKADLCFKWPETSNGTISKCKSIYKAEK